MMILLLLLLLTIIIVIMIMIIHMINITIVILKQNIELLKTQSHERIATGFLRLWGVLFCPAKGKHVLCKDACSRRYVFVYVCPEGSKRASSVKCNFRACRRTCVRA